MKTAKERPDLTVEITRNTVADKQVVRIGDVVTLEHDEAKLLIGMGKAVETDKKHRRQTKEEALGLKAPGKADAKKAEKPVAEGGGPLGPDPLATQQAKAQKRG